MQVNLATLNLICASSEQQKARSRKGQWKYTLESDRHCCLHANNGVVSSSLALAPSRKGVVNIRGLDYYQWGEVATILCGAILALMVLAGHYGVI